MPSTPLRPAPAWAHGSGLIHLSAVVVVPSAQDYQLLADRLHRYAWGFDERRRDILEDCFTGDAIWQANVMGETPVGPFRGHAAVLDWLTCYWEHQRDQRRHVFTNFVVSAAATDTATALAYLVLIGSSRSATRMESVGVYQVDYRREGEAWRITTLTAGFDAPYWKHEVSQMSKATKALFGIRENNA